MYHTQQTAFDANSVGGAVFGGDMWFNANNGGKLVNDATKDAGIGATIGSMGGPTGAAVEDVGAVDSLLYGEPLLPAGRRCEETSQGSRNWFEVQ